MLTDVIIKRFIAEKVCTASSRTSYTIIPRTNFNKYLRSDTNETEVNVNVSVNSGSDATVGVLVYSRMCFVLFVFV
jgi:hypothetical protein